MHLPYIKTFYSYENQSPFPANTMTPGIEAFQCSSSLKTFLNYLDRNKIDKIARF